MAFFAESAESAESADADCGMKDKGKEMRNEEEGEKKNGPWQLIFFKKFFQFFPVAGG